VDEQTEAGVAASPPGQHRWRRGVAAAATGQLFSIIGFSCFYSFLPLFFQTLGVASPEAAGVWAGAATFTQAIMVAIFSPIWGGIADRYGGKPMVLRALYGGGSIFIVLATVQHAWQVLALFVLLGCLTGVNTAIVTMVSAITPRERMGMAIGVCQTCVFVGASIGPAIGGVIADTFSYRASIRAGAIFMCLAGTVVLLGVREPRKAPGQVGGRRAGPFAAFRPGALSRPLVLLIAMIFLVQFSLQMLSPVLPIFIQQLSQSPGRIATLVGVVLGAGGVASAIGAIVCGRAADRFGRQRVLGWCTAGGALSMFVQAFVPGILPLALLRGVSGLFTGGLSASTNASVGELAPAGSRGAAFGVSGSAFSLGNAFGPLLGGLLGAAVGPRFVIGLSSVALAIGWWLVYQLGREQSQAVAERATDTPP
jgi:MFS transporter, DHA1 family, multidrug resistance protein